MEQAFYFFLSGMGKDFLSYVLLFCAAWVAYVYVSDYLDNTMQNNFTTPAVNEVNKKVGEIGVSSSEYKIGVQETDQK